MTRQRAKNAGRPRRPPHQTNDRATGHRILAMSPAIRSRKRMNGVWSDMSSRAFRIEDDTLARLALRPCGHLLDRREDLLGFRGHVTETRLDLLHISLQGAIVNRGVVCHQRPELVSE